MKPLHYINLIGVLALAALCVAQWQRDRKLNLEVSRLENVRLDHEAKIAEQEQAMRGLNADLAQFKDRFTKSGSELNDTRQKLRASKRELLQLASERDQLKTSVTNWANAVAARDERLNEANAEIRRLAEELNASIRKFNELATNHNAVVKDLNELRARFAQTQPASQ
jgi:chromosome segregation ATPase